VGDIVDNFMTRYNRFNASGIGTDSLFAELNSAFNTRNPSDRQATIGHVVAAQDTLLDNGFRQLSKGANAYAFRGLDYIINVPFENGGFSVVDEVVPFYQMVTRGYIGYTGTPVNTASDIRLFLLMTIETGSGVYAQWMYEDNSIVRDSFFTRFFSHNQDRNFRRAVDVYHEAAAVLNRVQGQRMVNHEILENGLRRVTYENGVRIWVNYSNYPLTDGNITVQPWDYWVS
jgi:hypothetical protein